MAGVLLYVGLRQMTVEGTVITGLTVPPNFYRVNFIRFPKVQKIKKIETV